MSTPEEFMARAVAISGEHMRKGLGGPFGAVVVKDGKIIGEGANQVTSSNDPTAHAEVVAIREACRTLGTFSLAGCEIYASCEPCPMCLASIYWARIEKAYFANNREDAAAIGFDDSFLYDEVAKPIDRRSLPLVHLPSTEAGSIFQEWRDKENKIPY
jgi:guanine deaminase